MATTRQLEETGEIAPGATRAVLTVIAQFRIKCDKAEYTDTGECWEVFEFIEKTLKR